MMPFLGSITIVSDQDMSCWIAQEIADVVRDLVIVSGRFIG